MTIEELATVSGAVVAVVALLVTAYQIKRTSDERREERHWHRRADAYDHVVQLVVRWRDYGYAARPVRPGQPGAVDLDRPVSQDEWLSAQALIEAYGSDSVRESALVIPGHAMAFEAALSEQADTRWPDLSPSERRAAIEHGKEMRADFVQLCDKVIESIRAELAP